MKQSFIKKLSLLTVLLVMTFGAFAQVGNSLALLTSTNTSPIEHQTTQTRADVLYNNDVPTTTSGLISVYWAGSDVLVQIADDFEGLAGWSIEEVVTNGFSNTSTIPTTYGIHFYADDNGKPGEELYSNINCQGVEGDVITITLPEAFVIETDGKYWISIYGVRSTAQDFTTRFDIYTSTTGVGSKLHLIDHANIFGAGTNWQSVDPSLVSGELSMTFTLYGEIVEIGQPPVEAGEAVATIQGANVHLAWEPETTTGLTGFEIYRRDCYATDWEGAELIAGNIPAAQTEYMDYSWAAADYGVYNWGVFAYYESEPTAIYSSNCLDKDMLVEVDVTVTLNDGEAATGTVVTFTNTSEPDLELVYEVTLTATGKYTWDEFRKGTYDISVVKEGFASATETDYQITEDESFTWLLEENLNQPIDLYVTPTAYASWKGTVPAPTEPVVVTIGEGTTSVSDAPFYTLYNYSYAQQIFDADEIGSSGTINSVAFQYNTTLATLSRNVKIYLGNTTQNTFATTSDWVVATDLELVYEGTIDIDNSNEWLVIEFDTPFAYTGDNLVLATADVTGTWTSSRSSLGHTASEKTLVSFRDGSVITPEAPMTSGAVYKRPYRNNVQFGMDVPVIDRAAVQYKVFLNQTFIANTNTPYYQYDVATLTVGEDYLSEVLVEYSTGQSSKAYYTFTYAGCEAYNPPTALASTQPIGTKDAVLTWTNPSLTDVDFLRVYRNGKVYKNKLSMDTPFTTWTDPELENGTYNYALTLVYDDGAETCLTAATTAVTIKSTGIAKGKVTYALGGNVNGATITISNTSNTYTLTTNASGDYTGTVEAGDYEIKCEFAGHISQTTNITVAYVGETTTNFSLLEIPVALQEVLAWEEGNAVQVSWTGGPPPPPGEYARIELVANDTWGDGTGYIALLDEDAEFAPDFTGALFYTEIPMSIFSKAEYTVPEDATNLLATTPKVVTGSAYVDIPAGTYDYALLSPDQASGRIWTVGSGGPAQPIGDNFVFEPNKKYTFTFAMYGTGDGAALTVEDFSFKGVAMNIVYPKPVVTNNTPVEKVSSLDASSKTEKFDKLSPEELSVLYSANNYVQVDKGTRALTGYDVYRTDCYDGELELLASLPATAGSFIDNQWSGLDFGVYKWGVVSVYELNESEVTYSNCLDKDMITEVSVKVNLNTAESPVDTKVTLVNISEPDMELVYEVKLDETGYFLFEEFRKGEYDITVFKFGYELLELTEEISEATDFVWLLEELIDPPLDLYVSPTGYATWTVATPPAFEGLYENFDAGIPDTWTVVNGGSTPDTWQVSTRLLNGTPCVIADSDAAGSGSTMDEMLYSPIVDASMCEELYLSFIQYYYHLGTSQGKVEVYDGSAWVNVLTLTATSGSLASPNAREIDVTPYVNENFQVRFNYVSPGWNWYWIIDDVLLSEAPAKDRAIQYYKVWLDGVFEADTPDQFYQHDVTNLVEDQEYTTEVAIFYTSGLSDKIDYTWTYKPCEIYGGALTFEAEVTGDQEVTLNWTLPEGGGPGPGVGYEGWMKYCVNDEVAGRIGYSASAGEDMTMAIRFTASDLSTYGVESGQTITKVALGMGQELSNVNTMEILFWEGGSSITDAGTLIYTQAITNFTTFSENTMVDIELTTPVTVDPSKELRVGWRLVNTAGYPFGRDAGPVAAAGKSDLFKCAVLNGGAWVSYSATYGWSNNICIKAFVSGGGKSIVLGEEYTSNYNTPAVSIATAEVIDRSNTQSEVAPSFGNNGVASRAQWDLVKEFNLNAGGEQGIATDGEYIYTAFWGTAGKFSKYEMDGTYIEDFTISGGGATRDITYDGEYFYGSAGSTTIYKYDFANKTLIGTISSAKTARHISYDPETGGFYVGDWSDLSLISSTGSLVSTCPAPSSAYGSAYYAPSDGSGPYLFLNTQDGGYGTSNVYTYDISSNTMSTTYVNVAASMTGIDPTAAIAGGAFIADYDGKLCFFANIQQTPNKVGIFELEEGIIIPPPPVEEILGVNLYRDGEFIAFVPEDVNEYVDEGVYYGDHEYCIRVVYVSLAMSCEGQCETVPIPYPCDPTGNLEGVNPQDTQNALISWGAEPIEEWLKYDDGINVDGIGGPSTFIWAVKFDPNQLSHLDGTSLTKISIYKYAAGTDELRIYQGNNAATLLHSQQLDGLVVSMYQDVELSSPVALDVTQQLWIAVSTTNGTTYPAGCGNYAGNPNSDLISQDGGATWEHINDMGLPYSWNLRGYVTNVRGVEMAIPMEKPIDPISTEAFVARGKGHYNEAPVIVTRSNDALQGYNVYRKLSTESTYTVVGNVPAVSGQMTYEFLDADLTPGKYHFQVRALYEFEDGYECESEPALTPDESQNFVEVIIETGIDSYGAEARIYPNPASNYITIEAAKMNRITVMSMVGQVVYDVKVDSNQESVDVSSLKSGVYIVRISTESGVSTERITIVR